ncbi:DMT family transporter [Paludibacterium paludis]|uniref:Multidrug DMT transporter permease n=1 Tax=Paludibacterium paludis TaxID=1225769 RepID=A0A918P5A3_9NEIS|nr:DMT family transporter [Paludibacterium paludis]GGY22332.1 multidrug DMT transporter permease [Paludibacterium paludis]
MVFLPGLFVVLWSTGFIVSRAIAPFADSTLFLCARFGLSALLFCIVAKLIGAAWPPLRAWPRHMAIGILMYGSYLCASFKAVALGLPPAVMALFGAFQPMLTALIAWHCFGERPGASLFAGLAAGFCGVALVMLPLLLPSRLDGGMTTVLLLAAFAIAALTAGTLLQRTLTSSGSLWSSAALQNAASLLLAGLLAWLSGESRWEPGVVLYGALFWSVLGLSGAGSLILVLLVNRGHAARATSLLYLVPPLVAAQAYYFFDGALTTMQMAGFAIALAGVAVCRRKERPNHDPAPRAQ